MGVKNPQGSSDLPDMVELAGVAICTSGSYRRRSPTIAQTPA
ncbi:hypothetical protein [Sulfobacillus harzensis]|uniref:FAD:protein FMN transferase n=1 Tax=Sulfobacillus harzensis TaxID=2729629 RepID=A0A7Y0L8C9_9FIRM|nr:FAD:protein FMN transferase [Sulfobacillus harzensis]